jgi:hypothetical protein
MTAPSRKCLVIDADVMRAAGGLDRDDPRSSGCSLFLQAVLEVCHSVAVTDVILEEWEKHQSYFASTWETSMEQHRKRLDTTPAFSDDLRARIAATAPGEGERAILQKDMHLIEAALAADMVVVSLDITARYHFAHAAESVTELRELVWISPVQMSQCALRAWLEDGATPEEPMKLGVSAK